MSSLYGYGSYSPQNLTGTPNTASSLNSSLVDNLSTQATESGWNKWLLLHLNGGSINNLAQETIAVTGKHFPDPLREGNSFLLWCEDVDCTVEYDPKTSDLSSITELYARWTVIVVTFNPNGGTTPSPATKNVTYSESYETSLNQRGLGTLSLDGSTKRTRVSLHPLLFLFLMTTPSMPTGPSTSTPSHLRWTVGVSAKTSHRTTARL